MLCVLLGLQAGSLLAKKHCDDQLSVGSQMIAYYEDDGYRPLSTEEASETLRDSPMPSNNWRPAEQDEDCRRPPSMQAEDRGYRPLDYGRQRSSQKNRPTYVPDRAYKQNQRRQAPDYSQGKRGLWSQGDTPYFTEPPILPGYGVMPFSFDGKGATP